MTIAVVGHANPNKRIDQVILALGASPRLRRCCRVRVIGESTEDERERLAAIARAAQVAPPEFTGWVSDEDLRWQLRDVDVIACLRNPVLEGGSASLVLGLSSARPTLVTHHGSYGELPDGVVLACSPEHEARDALRHLERLLDDPTRGRAMGERAREVARQLHSPASYAEALIPLLERVAVVRPRRLAMRRLPMTPTERAARRDLTDTLTGFGLPADDPSVARVEAVLAEMLRGVPEEM